MSTLLNLTIVAACLAATSEGRYPNAAAVFSCGFEEDWDANYDQWPDGWIRKRATGYPHYLAIGVVQEPTTEGDRCLKIEMNGGAATLYSPPIKINVLHSYVLETALKTVGLEHDEIYVTLKLLDGEQQLLETIETERFTRTDGWRKLRIGPFAPGSADAAYVVIGLHVMPTGRQDLSGAALFDDLWLGRLPRIKLTTGRTLNLYRDPGQVEIEASISGILPDAPILALSLEDAHGRVIATEQQSISVTDEPVGNAPQPADAATDRSRVVSTRWIPPISEPGFYRIRAMVELGPGDRYARSVNVAVLGDRPPVAQSEFGWSLPEGDRFLSHADLLALLADAGLGWVKYPLWYAEDDRQRADRIAWFAERLLTDGIRVVGLLTRPPADPQELFKDASELTGADIFTAPNDAWYPLLEPVMLRLSMKVRHWQLSRDDDWSFVGYQNLPTRLADIRHKISRVGTNVNIGIGWNWLQEPPVTEEPICSFLCVSARPPLTANELGEYLDESRLAGAEPWVSIQPLPHKLYSNFERAKDLVQRMLAAKVHGAATIIVADPFHPESGLMNQDGSPTELFLPWRTAAFNLAGAKFLGRLQLPDGSENYVFARESDAVLVVWNESPTREVVYLGENVTQMDIWGRSWQPQNEGHRQVIQVGPVPTFITGVDPFVTRWRMQFQLQKDRVPSVFGRLHDQGYELTNLFPQGVTGRMEIQPPEGWTITPTQFPLQLAAGEESAEHFGVKFPFDAESGQQMLRVDFEVAADKTYKFSVYRPFEVGMGDVKIELETHLDDSGVLIVQQRLTNHSNRTVSFMCNLHAPDRRRKRAQVSAFPGAQRTHVYHIPDGAEILGQKLWLRAEEIGHSRVLSYRFVAER